MKKLLSKLTLEKDIFFNLNEVEYLDYFNYESLASNKEHLCYVAIKDNFLYIYDKNHLTHSPILKLYLCGCNCKLYQSKKVNRLEVSEVNGEIHTFYHMNIDNLNTLIEKINQTNLKLVPNFERYYGVINNKKNVIHNVYLAQDEKLKIEEIFKDIKADFQSILSSDDKEVKKEIINCLTYFAQADKLKDEIISISIPIIESLQDIYKDKSNELLLLSILQLCSILIHSNNKASVIPINYNILYEILDNCDNIKIIRSVISILYIYLCIL